MTLTRRHLAILLAAVSSAPTGLARADGDPRGSRIKDITPISQEQLNWMEEVRRTCPGLGRWIVHPDLVARSQEVREIVAAGRSDRIADLVLGVYDKPEAWREITAVGIALLQEAGYARRITTGDRNLGRRVDKSLPKRDEKKLVASVEALLDALLARDHPRRKDAAAEVLLSVFWEGKVTQHSASDNGNRRPDNLPTDLAGRAAELLGAEDPFVHAMGEWSINICVANRNDFMGWGKPRITWGPDAEMPWFRKWQALPADEHLDLDYMRQAISLEMHRRGEDLLTLAGDVMRRARARAAWAGHELEADTRAEQHKALEAMSEAYEALARLVEQEPDNLTACRKQWLAFRRTVRPVVLAGPDVNFDQLVYIKRYSGGFHLQPGIHGIKYPDGGDIYVQTGLEPTSAPSPLIGDRIPKGYAQDLDLWYDADRIVFSHMDKRRIQKLYEMKLDGSELTKVTDGNYHDVDPAYLPDGKIVFASLRAEAAAMCSKGLGNVAAGGSDQGNIYRVDPVSGDIRRLSYCKDDDCYPHVLNDGRIVFLRWDYQERGVNEIMSLWAVRPDGTYADGYYRVHLDYREIIMALRDARAVPGGTRWITAAGGAHYSANEGVVMLCDTFAGINNPEGLLNVTPNASPTPQGLGSKLRTIPEGGVPYIGGYTKKPYALSEKSFLATFGFDMPMSCNGWLYYLDVWGNKELIHRDKLMETVAVHPVRKRPKPPVIPDMTDQEANHATVFVENVYRDLPGVEEGEVKYLRIAQQMFWITRAGRPGLQYHPLANGAECFGYPGTGGPVRVIGTVPVHEDGSAGFEVPAGADLYFQALDENYRAVQRMRTHVELAPGEKRGCVGCHETRGDTARPRVLTTAMKSTPVRPEAPPWGDRAVMNYEKMIQPIFEAKCVKCHGAKDPKAGLDLTANRGGQGFMQSYRSMFGLKPTDPTPRVVWNAAGPVKRQRVKKPDHPWWEIMFDHVIVRKSIKGQGSLVNIPREYGAIRHPLATKLVEDKKHARLLSRDQTETLMTWFDVQSPYFDTYMFQASIDGKSRLMRVKVEPYAPFGDSREHTIHWPAEKTARK